MLQVLLIKTQMINFSANLEKNNFSIRRKIELGSRIGSGKLDSSETHLKCFICSLRVLFPFQELLLHET